MVVYILSYCYIDGEETSFAKISAVLRLSTKYNVDGLRRTVISLLATMYPRTLTEFRATYVSAFRRPFKAFPGEDHAVAALARDTSATVLLPAAYLRISEQDVECMVGYNSRDTDGDGADIHATDDIDYLTKEELVFCLKGRDELARGVRDVFLKAVIDMGRAGASSCECARDQRANAFVKLMNVVPLLPFSSKGGFNMFAFYDAFPIATVCVACHAAFMTKIETHLRISWDDLPRTFGLSSWDKLSSNVHNIVDCSQP